MSQTTELQNETVQNQSATAGQSGMACQNNQSDRAQMVRLRPRVDILELDDHFLLYVEVPGVKKDRLDVTLDKDALIIEGTAEFKAPENYRVLDGHPVWRKYERTFRLTDQIDRNGIEIELENGVAMFRLPKHKEAQRTKLTVK